MRENKGRAIKECVKVPMDKSKGGQYPEWEVGMGGAGGVEGGK